jgi:hypothetical protein
MSTSKSPYNEIIGKIEIGEHLTEEESSRDAEGNADSGIPWICGEVKSPRTRRSGIMMFA